MNSLNLFKYLEKEKGKPIPLRLKLVHGLLLNPEDLDVKGDLYLDRTNITSLPQDLKVGGNLDLANTKITSLPEDLQVERHLWLRNTPLTKKSDEEIRAMLTTGYIKGEIIR